MVDRQAASSQGPVFDDAVLEQFCQPLITDMDPPAEEQRRVVANEVSCDERRPGYRVHAPATSIGHIPDDDVLNDSGTVQLAADPAAAAPRSPSRR